MPEAKFLPSKKSVEAFSGEDLLDAAARAGVVIDLQCGGKGTCGKCLVEILNGELEYDSSDPVLQQNENGKFALACKSKIQSSPVTVEIPESLSTDYSGDSDDLFEEPDAVQQIEPLSKKIIIDIPLPQAEDGLSDFDRLFREIKKKLLIDEIICGLPVLRSLADILRKNNWRVTATVVFENGRCTLVRVESGNNQDRHFGIAVDIGTTTISVQLVDMNSGKITGTRNGYNDQIKCGLDVISRINYSSRKNGLHELKSLVTGTINRLIKKLTENFSIDGDEITSAIISGNTVMMHLLLELKPEYIRLEPYTPTVLSLQSLSAEELDIKINPSARVLISPCVGSYVGGDITAGILCTDITLEKEETNLFIDIGTNGEIVLGNSDFLLTCACSAGPAFEGGGIENGMRASTGAIDRITIDSATGMCSYFVIGGEKPRGICGSGMIELVAGLFLTGWLDPSGRLNRDRDCPRIHIDGRRAFYVIADADETASGKSIVISENDIENIMRAKAAIYSATALMLSHAGLKTSDLAHVYVAGGFGRYLNINHAVTIGLLPDISLERYIYLGNASLKGSYMLLLSEKQRNIQRDATRRMTYIDLSNDPDYMHHYTAALFLPHTDMRNFPSVIVKT
jgi:uncharacterized 2Fe-2S/4Fe-4S cluster protein (DUF4445 family)